MELLENVHNEIGAGSLGDPERHDGANARVRCERGGIRLRGRLTLPRLGLVAGYDTRRYSGDSSRNYGAGGLGGRSFRKSATVDCELLGFDAPLTFRDSSVTLHPLPRIMVDFAGHPSRVYGF